MRGNIRKPFYFVPKWLPELSKYFVTNKGLKTIFRSQLPLKFNHNLVIWNNVSANVSANVSEKRVR